MWAGDERVSSSDVHAILQSLRKRSGLTQDRLESAGDALDILARLDSVQRFAAGNEVTGAVVLAVRQATASMRSPTVRLIIDAALALELMTKDVGDEVRAQLYAAELFKRREALKKHWVMLHEVLGDTPPPTPSVRNLRLVYEESALAELAQILVSGGGWVEGSTTGESTADTSARGDLAPLVVIVGDAVADKIVRLPNDDSEPAVQADDYVQRSGGKGLNQALGVGRLGLRSQLIAAIGDDLPASNEILRTLRHESVDSRLVHRVEGADTPIAIVESYRSGRTKIIAYKNHAELRFPEGFLQSAGVTQALQNAAVVMLTQEQSRSVIHEIVREVGERPRCPIILTASPVYPSGTLGWSVLAQVDYLICGRAELRKMMEISFTGADESDADEDDIIATHAHTLLQTGVRNVCVLRPAHGSCSVHTDMRSITVEGPSTTTSDLTASPDAFAAALAYRLVINSELGEDDYKWACAAMALARTELGTSNSMPKLDDINLLVDRWNTREEMRAARSPQSVGPHSPEQGA